MVFLAFAKADQNKAAPDKVSHIHQHLTLQDNLINLLSYGCG